MSLRRERLRCESCEWVGVTWQGKLRAGIFVAGLLAAGAMIGFEQLGVTELGDQAWVGALTILLLSFAARIAVRGDRCDACQRPIAYERVRG